jgi:hypothetical protein
MENRHEGRQFFDLKSSPFSGEVKDEDVRAAFLAKMATFGEERDPGISWLTCPRRADGTPKT